MNAAKKAALKLLVHTVGRWSDGIRIALDHGFTSGKIVDYACRNRPAGKNAVGRFIDRLFLANEGWQAVRRRKQHLREELVAAFRRGLAAGGDLLVLDVAAGQASYLLEAAAAFPGEALTAFCWDIEDAWLREGRAAARRRGLGNVHFQNRDSLQHASFRALTRRPDVVIAAGMYEWLGDGPVEQSMDLVAAHLAPGGLFLFTVQTGHVDVDMVNDVFPGFDGPMTITVRPLEQVRRWIAARGFAVEAVRADRWHYHTLIAARKHRRHGKHRLVAGG